MCSIRQDIAQVLGGVAFNVVPTQPNGELALERLSTAVRCAIPHVCMLVTAVYPVYELNALWAHWLMISKSEDKSYCLVGSSGFAFANLGSCADIEDRKHVVHLQWALHDECFDAES